MRKDGSEIYISGLELEVLSVFIKNDILKDAVVIDVLETLVKKLK